MAVKFTDSEMKELEKFAKDHPEITKKILNHIKEQDAEVYAELSASGEPQAAIMVAVGVGPGTLAIPLSI